MPDNSPKQGSTTSPNIVGTMPAYMKNTAPATIPAGMPGQISALAQQLGIGFGQSPKAMTDFLGKIYQPAQTMNFNVPPPKPKTPVTPVTPVDPKKPSDKYTYTYTGGRNSR